MKRLAAIFLLLIFLFNLGGYRLWYFLLEQSSDRRLVTILEEEKYDEAELVEIKIPLSLPYQANWKEFEPTEGEIAIGAIIYKYVKRKVLNGELILLCIPHHDKMEVNTARNDFFKFAHDLARNTSGQNPGSQAHNFKNPFSDYYLSGAPLFQIFLPGIGHNFKLQYKTGHLVSVPHISPEQPPDFSGI